MTVMMIHVRVELAALAGARRGSAATGSTHRGGEHDRDRGALKANHRGSCRRSNPHTGLPDGVLRPSSRRPGLVYISVDNVREPGCPRVLGCPALTPTVLEARGGHKARAGCGNAPVQRGRTVYPEQRPERGLQRAAHFGVLDPDGCRAGRSAASAGADQRPADESRDVRRRRAAPRWTATCRRLPGGGARHPSNRHLR